MTGSGCSFGVPHEAIHSFTCSWGMPLPASSDVIACLIRATCHSFVSRYAVIASAARNERERTVLLASFWSLLLVERSTRTEKVSVFICVQYITLRDSRSMGLCLGGCRYRPTAGASGVLH